MTQSARVLVMQESKSKKNYIKSKQKKTHKNEKTAISGRALDENNLTKPNC